jgi:hypothetical protein
LLPAAREVIWEGNEMTADEQPRGRWTRLFGGPTRFAEDVKKAKEVASTVQLFGVGDLSDHQYVKIVFEGVDGWERPLWASDGQWLYLRRPQGIWKTRLPMEHLGRIGVICQSRRGSSRIYGGIRVGNDFSDRPSWHVHMEEVEPEAMDDFYGLPLDGHETGPMISDWVEDVGRRVVMDAGDVFSAPPKSCRFVDGEVRAEAADGRKVRFPISASLDLGAIAGRGDLWLRFGHGLASWMDPFDCQVTA